MNIVHPQLTIDWLRENFTRKGVTAAVIDSGVDASHPDLAGVVVRGCVVRRDKQGSIQWEEVPGEECFDSYGHGTSVAGAVLQVAPDVRVVSVKVLNEYNQCTGEELIAGLGWPAYFSSVVSVDREEFDAPYRVRYLPHNPIQFGAHGTNVVLPALNQGYEQRTGTSFATPHVTGVIALMLEAFPDLLPWEAKTVLKWLFPKNAASTRSPNRIS